MNRRLQIPISDYLDVAIRRAAQRRQCSAGERVRRTIDRALDQEHDQQAEADPERGRVLNFEFYRTDVKVLESSY